MQSLCCTSQYSTQRGYCTCILFSVDMLLMSANIIMLIFTCYVIISYNLQLEATYTAPAYSTDWLSESVDR